MYFEFPFFGLGQGAFYRLSALPEFSGSEFLVRMHGEGVHNEFLRILVELGPIGLGLVLFIAIPFARLGRQNFHWVSFYALAGIAIGNFYTNALLVRELLLLCAVFAGSYFWEVAIERLGAVAAAVASDNALRFDRPADACAGSICRSCTEPQQVPVHLRAALFRSSAADRGRLDARCTARPRSVGGGER